MSAVTYMSMNDECDLVPFFASLVAPVVVSCNCTQGLYGVAHLTACAVALYLPTQGWNYHFCKFTLRPKWQVKKLWESTESESGSLTFQ